MRTSPLRSVFEAEQPTSPCLDSMSHFRAHSGKRAGSAAVTLLLMLTVLPGSALGQASVRGPS